MVAIIMGDTIAKDLYNCHNEGYIFTIDTIADWAIEWEYKHRKIDWEDFNESPAKYGYPESEVACWDDAVIYSAKKYLEDFKKQRNLPLEITEISFDPDATPDQVWVLAFDTVCEGWNCVTVIGEDNKSFIALYDEPEADFEISQDPDTLFKVHKSEYIHNRRTFINVGPDQKISGHITGVKPKE